MGDQKDHTSKFASLDAKIDGKYYYSMFVKFGQGRAMNEACRDICDGFINREEAVELMQRYDGEFPEKYFPEVLMFMDIKKRYWEIINKARPTHLWEEKNGEWTLKHAVWEQTANV